MLRTAILILSGNATTSLLLLTRNLLVARLIPVVDYGIAATFAVAMAVVEMMSALGLQQHIIQSKDGDNPRFQSALQGFQVVRGSISAILLLIFASQIATFLNVPEVTWAYQVLALVPFMNALVHFDIYRMNRAMQFKPLVLFNLVPALVSLASVWPLSLIYDDYRVMLYAMLIQTAGMLTTSHILAQRRYALRLDATVIRRSLRFGWPLLVESILLFAVFNGDKLIVGRELGMEELAIFSLGFTLTLTPMLVMERSIQNLFLPQLSLARQGGSEKHAEFEHLARSCVQAHLASGLLIATAIMLCGELAVDILLDERFVALVPVLSWLGILQCMRVFKTSLSTVSLACAMTENSLMANIPRVALLPVAWWLAMSTGDIYMVIAIGVVGELVGFVVATGLARWRIGLSPRPIIPAVFFGALALIAIGLHALSLRGDAWQLLGPGSTTFWALAGTAIAITLMTELRIFILGMFNRKP